MRPRHCAGPGCCAARRAAVRGPASRPFERPSLTRARRHPPRPLARRVSPDCDPWGPCRCARECSDEGAAFIARPNSPGRPAAPAVSTSRLCSPMLCSNASDLSSETRRSSGSAMTCAYVLSEHHSFNSVLTQPSIVPKAMKSLPMTGTHFSSLMIRATCYLGVLCVDDVWFGRFIRCSSGGFRSIDGNSLRIETQLHCLSEAFHAAVAPLPLAATWVAGHRNA